MGVKEKRDAKLRSENIIRVFLFVVFFGIGAAALSSSILCSDLLRYYHDKELLESEKELSNQLKSLNADYDALLEQLDKDPNLIKRIAPATLGMEHNDVDTIYPKATAEQLAAARKALTEEMGLNTTGASLPEWLTHCREPAPRIMLFFAGAGLILVSFICFGPAKKKSGEETKKINRRER